jgi:phosphatidylglycerophosphate synthase
MKSKNLIKIPISIDFHNWIIGNAVAMTIASISTYFFHSFIWLIGTALAAFLMLFQIAKMNKKSWFTLPNLVTALRFFLISCTMLTATYLSNYQLFILFGIAIFMDGLDGYIAKRYQQTSALGALFDKEVDAFLVLILSFLLVRSYAVSPFLLIIGYLHYGYELFIYSLGWQALETPKNPIGRYMAAILFMGLLSPFILNIFQYQIVLLISSILVSFSFALSFWFKLKAALLPL